MKPGEIHAVGFAGGAPGTEYCPNRKTGANTGPDIVLTTRSAATAIALSRPVQAGGNRIGGNNLSAFAFQLQALKGQVNIDSNRCGVRQNRPGSLGG